MNYKVGSIYKRTFKHPDYWHVVKVIHIDKNKDMKYYQTTEDIDVYVCELLADSIPFVNIYPDKQVHFCSDTLLIAVEEVLIKDLPLYISYARPALKRLFVEL